jgi:hypothetical protein
VISKGPILQDVSIGILNFDFALDIDVDNESDPARSIMKALRTCPNRNCLKKHLN